MSRLKFKVVRDNVLFDVKKLEFDDVLDKIVWAETFASHGLPPQRILNPKIIQSTGLKDKNGKEIFEGDILQFSRYWSDHFNKETTQIFWFEENAQFLFDHARVAEYLIGQISAESKIVGNIYKNPDLLEAK